MNKKEIVIALEKQIKVLTKDQDIRLINEKIAVSQEVRNLCELMMKIEDSQQADNKGYFEKKPSSKLDVTSNDSSFEDLRKGISDTMEKYKPRVTVPTEVILDNGKTFQ